MINQEISRLFAAIADALEFKEENRFRVLAYRRGSEAVADAAVKADMRTQQRIGTRADNGRAIVLLGLIAVVRVGCSGAVEPTAASVGEPLSLELADLAGDELRLLPGIGPVLAERLEAARSAAGGTLDEATCLAVPGIGKGLLARWRRLQAR